MSNFAKYVVFCTLCSNWAIYNQCEVKNAHAKKLLGLVALTRCSPMRPGLVALTRCSPMQPGGGVTVSRANKITKLKQKALGKLSKMLDSDNETVVFKSVAIILELPEADEGAFGEMARLLSEPGERI